MFVLSSSFRFRDSRSIPCLPEQPGDSPPNVQVTKLSRLHDALTAGVGWQNPAMPFPLAFLVSVRGDNTPWILLLSEKTDSTQLSGQQLLREPLLGFYFLFCSLLPQKNTGTPSGLIPAFSSGKRDVLLRGQTPNALTY